jgi:hypothetical protein
MTLVWPAVYHFERVAPSMVPPQARLNSGNRKNKCARLLRRVLGVETGSTTDDTQQSDRVRFVSLAGVSVTAPTYHNNTRRHGLWNAVSSERSCGSLGLAAMPDTPGSRIVGPKARRKKWSVHPSSGYLASRPFRTLNWLAWGTRHAREVSLWRHSCDLHVQGRLWRTRGPQRGSVKQLPRLRARTGHAPCAQAAAFAPSLSFTVPSDSGELQPRPYARRPYLIRLLWTKHTKPAPGNSRRCL